jgi:hypothetical protein
VRTGPLATTLEAIARELDHVGVLQRRYLLSPEARLWVSNLLRDDADELEFASELLRTYADIVDREGLDPPLAPPAVPFSPPVAARAPAVARPRHPPPPALPRSP